MSHDARTEKDAKMRLRVARFIDDPEAVEGLFPEEIRAAITGAIDHVVAFLEVDDGAKPN